MEEDLGSARSAALEAHEFITVLARRWCLKCAITQSHTGGAWRPWASGACAANTPFAEAQRATARNPK